MESSRPSSPDPEAVITSANHAGHNPVRRRAADWRAVIEQQNQSGLSITAFCQQHQIATASFYLWRKRLRLEPATEPGRFVELQASDASSSDPTVSRPVQLSEPATTSPLSTVESACASHDRVEVIWPNGLILRVPTPP